MSSTKISAPRTLETLPSAWIEAIGTSSESNVAAPRDVTSGCDGRQARGARRSKLATKDRIALVVHGEAEARHERPGVAAMATLAGRGDACDDGRQGRLGELRVEVADAGRSRIRGQRPELCVDDRRVVHEEDLAVAAEDTAAPDQKGQLARRVRTKGRGRPAGRRKRIVRQRIVTKNEGVEPGVATGWSKRIDRRVLIVGEG